MQLLKRLLIVLLLLLVLTFGVLFSFQNMDKVALDLLVIRLPELPVAVWVLLSFAAGGVGGVAISAVALVRRKSQYLLLQRRCAKLEQELSKLRTSDLRAPLVSKVDKS